VTLADLGRADRAQVSWEQTVIFRGRGQPEVIARRVEWIKAAADACEDSYKRDKLTRRLAQLRGGIAIIRYGGHTDAERNERRLRLEDAVASLWAAIRSGVVLGSGLSLVQAAPVIDSLDLAGDAAIGAQIVRIALSAPFRQLVANAGQDGNVVLAELQRIQRERSNTLIGYDVRDGQYCDVATRGIMDPTEVVTVALETAASCAGMILTTEAIVLSNGKHGRANRQTPTPTARIHGGE
jgi:chaperonin GroEL